MKKNILLLQSKGAFVKLAVGGQQFGNTHTIYKVNGYFHASTHKNRRIKRIIFSQLNGKASKFCSIIFCYNKIITKEKGVKSDNMPKICYIEKSQGFYMFKIYHMFLYNT